MLETIIFLLTVLGVILLVSFLFSGVLGAFGIRVGLGRAFLILLCFGSVLILVFFLINMILAFIGLAAI